MKNIRIRHRVDRQMHFGKTGWTLNSASAMVFDTPLEALAFVIHREILNAELVGEVLDSTAEVAIAV
jgi:hypothetical protein